MDHNSEHIDLDFTTSPPFFSFYRNKLNRRTYKSGASQLQQIVLTRHDPPSRNWNLPYVDEYGPGYNGVLDEFQANSSAHDSDKAIRAYSLGINDNAQYYHFVMDKDTLLALASMILQLTVDEPPSEVVKKNSLVKLGTQGSGLLNSSSGMPPIKIKD